MHQDQRLTPDTFCEDLDSTAPPGNILLLGASDSGKSTLASMLARRLAEKTGAAAWLDGDIGQSTLGLPTTLNLALVEKKGDGTPPPLKTFFVGLEDAAGGRLALLTGLKRLQEQSSALKARSLVIDTTGFVDKTAGGLALKQYKIELLQPDTVVALQFRRELEPVLAPLRKHSRIRVRDLCPAAETRNKSRERRIRTRRRKFQDYFHSAREIELSVSELPVHDLPRCRKHSLTGLLDERGLCLALGIVLAQENGTLRVLTPLANTESLAAARLSSLRLDPSTGLTY